MADDEVPSLVEMGLYEVPGNAFSVPAAQIERLPKASAGLVRVSERGAADAPAQRVRLPRPFARLCDPALGTGIRRRGAVAGTLVRAPHWRSS